MAHVEQTGLRVVNHVISVVGQWQGSDRFQRRSGVYLHRGQSAICHEEFALIGYPGQSVRLAKPSEAIDSGTGFDVHNFHRVIAGGGHEQAISGGVESKVIEPARHRWKNYGLSQLETGFRLRKQRNETGKEQKRKRPANHASTLLVLCWL